MRKKIRFSPERIPSSPHRDRGQDGKGDHLLRVVQGAVEFAVDEFLGGEFRDQEEIERPGVRSLVRAVTPCALIRIRLRIARPIGIRHRPVASGFSRPWPRLKNSPMPSANSKT